MDSSGHDSDSSTTGCRPSSRISSKTDVSANSLVESSSIPINLILHKKLVTDFTLYELNDKETVSFYIKNMDYFIDNFPYFKDICLLEEYFVSNEQFKEIFRRKIDRFIQIVRYNPLHKIPIYDLVHSSSLDKEDSESDVKTDSTYDEMEYSMKENIEKNKYREYCGDEYSEYDYSSESDSSGDSTSSSVDLSLNSCVSDDSLSFNFEIDRHTTIEFPKVDTERFPNHFPKGDHFRINKLSLVCRCWTRIIMSYIDSSDLTRHFQMLLPYTTRKIIAKGECSGSEAVASELKKLIITDHKPSKDEFGDIAGSGPAQSSNVYVGIKPTARHSEAVFRKINMLASDLYVSNNLVSSLLSLIYVHNVSRILRNRSIQMSGDRSKPLRIHNILDHNIEIVLKIMCKVSSNEIGPEMTRFIMKQMHRIKNQLIQSFVEYGLQNGYISDGNESESAPVASTGLLERRNAGDIVDGSLSCQEDSCVKDPPSIAGYEGRMDGEAILDCGEGGQNNDREMHPEESNTSGPDSSNPSAIGESKELIAFVNHINSEYFNTMHFKSMYKAIVFILSFFPGISLKYKLNLDKYLQHSTPENSTIDMYTLFYIRLASMMNGCDMANLNGYIRMAFKFNSNPHLLISVFRIIGKLPSLRKLKVADESCPGHDYQEKEGPYITLKMRNAPREELAATKNESMGSKKIDVDASCRNDREYYFMDKVLRYLVDYAGEIYSGNCAYQQIYGHLIKLYNSNIRLIRNHEGFLDCPDDSSHLYSSGKHLNDIRVLLKGLSEMESGSYSCSEYCGFDRFVLDTFLSGMPYPSIFEEKDKDR